MPIYQCEKCNYTNANKRDFMKHMNKKNKCRSEVVIMKKGEDTIMDSDFFIEYVLYIQDICDNNNIKYIPMEDYEFEQN